MRKSIILLFALLCAGAVFGQKDKEVAVMQPYVMGGANVQETDKLLMVSAMEEAFTKIDGYKAFTRTNQKLIDAELSFQRSGKVADNQIKAVGAQTGVSYICTFTLAIDGNELVINAKIIDVETAQIINAKTETCSDRTNRDDLKKKCEALPYALLGVGISSSGTNNEKGVVINGMRWATRNVDEFGTFAATPESAGKFYQWNRKKAWDAIGGVSGWDNSEATGNTWEKANDPSPAGWRVPTKAEIDKLLDKTNVISEWTIQNGVTGRKFTDKATGNSLFLPVAGYRNSSDGTLNYAGVVSVYWSSTPYESVEMCAYGLYFDGGAAYVNSLSLRSLGFSVRPVSAK